MGQRSLSRDDGIVLVCIPHIQLQVGMTAVLQLSQDTCLQHIMRIDLSRQEVENGGENSVILVQSSPTPDTPMSLHIFGRPLSASAPK